MSAVENSRVGFDYTILEEIEAGLELLGIEVKLLPTDYTPEECLVSRHMLSIDNCVL